VHARFTQAGPPAVALLVLAAIGLVCVGGPGGAAMAADTEHCVGPGCERGIACDRAAGTGLLTSARPSNLPVAVTTEVGGIRVPEQAWAPAPSPPSPAPPGPSLAPSAPRSPPTV
jgi:hypothetical protein